MTLCYLKSIVNVQRGVQLYFLLVELFFFLFSLKIGEDDGVLEINRKLAGRVKLFLFDFLLDLESLLVCLFKVTMFFLVFVSTGWLECSSDLSVKGVQRRRSKWSSLARFLIRVCALAVEQVVTWSDIPRACLSTQHAIWWLGDWQVLCRQNPVKSHSKPISLFSTPTATKSWSFNKWHSAFLTLWKLDYSESAHDFQQAVVDLRQTCWQNGLHTACPAFVLKSPSPVVFRTALAFP